jgi:hypothetical protein
MPATVKWHTRHGLLLERLGEAKEDFEDICESAELDEIETRLLALEEAISASNEAAMEDAEEEDNDEEAEEDDE